jgi:taurine transport system substrate-binding protein
MKRKKIFGFMLSILASGTLAACGGADETTEQASTEGGNLPKEINIGYLRVPNDEKIAKTEALFDEYFADKGIETNFLVFDSGVEANQAFASGSIDFASMGNTNGIIALSRGLDVELIWLHEILGEIEALAVRKDSGIEKVEDLAGRTVATTFASTSHYSLLQILNDAGIADQVQLLDMKTLDIVAAWERGDIDAAYTWQPSLGRLLEDGNILISSAQAAAMGHKTANVLLARKGFTEQYPELTADFIAVLVEGGNIYRENPNQAAEIVANPLGITSEDALAQMQGSIWLTAEEQVSDEYMGTSETAGAFSKVMKETSDFLLGQGSITESPSQDEFDAFVNPQYIEMYLER